MQLRIAFSLIICISLFDCVYASQAKAKLRELAQKAGITFGCAIGSSYPSDTAYTRIIKEECNIAVSENDMKFASIHPQQNQYNWTNADAQVAFAQQNSMKFRGHCLVWHNQQPNWVMNNNFSRDSMLSIMKDHIKTVMTRYKGKVSEWDVVNEVIDDNGSLRNSFWLQKIGKDYIDSAFVYAHAADPSALLFYNDYNIEDMGNKSQKTYELISDMVNRKIPVHGVGFQSHLILNSFNVSQMETNIKRYAALKLIVNYTEVDIRMQLPADTAKLNAQEKNYRDLLAMFMRNRPTCQSFITWGITDRYSWIPSVFSGFGAALPFDENYKAKPAYNALWSVLNTSTSIKEVNPASSKQMQTTFSQKGNLYFDLKGREITKEMFNKNTSSRLMIVVPKTSNSNAKPSIIVKTK